MKESFEGLHTKNEPKKSIKNIIKKIGTAVVVFASLSIPVGSPQKSSRTFTSLSKKPEAVSTPKRNIISPEKNIKTPETSQTSKIEGIIPQKIIISEVEKKVFTKEYYEERFVVEFQIKDKEPINVVFSFGEKLEKNDISDGKKFYEALKGARPEEVNFTLNDNIINRVKIKGEVVYEN